MKKERWAFSESELKNPYGLNSRDELIAPIYGGEIGVFVRRNGNVTNRYDDGTVGVSREDRNEAMEVDSLYHPETG